MTLRKWILGGSILWACVAAQAQLVVNGSFEDGVFTPPGNATMSLAPGASQLQGWEIIGDSVAWIGVGNPFGLTASDGERLLDLTDYQSGAPFGGVRQTIASVPGREYVLSFYLGSATSQGRPSAVTVSAGETVETFTSPLDGTNNDWNLNSLRFTASGATTTISIAGVQGLHYIGVDGVSVAPLGGGVLVGGNEWRQLTETLWVSWNEVAAACPLDGTTPCSGSIVRANDGTSVDVTGWIWARNSDVQALLDAVIQPGTVNIPSEFTNYSSTDDPDIEDALSGGPSWFDPTRSDAAGRYLYGLTATAGSTTGYRPWLRDAIPGNTDWANLSTTLAKTSRQTYTGIWLFRPHGAGGELQGLTLNSSTVAGCKSVTGRVTLPGPAPAGGVVVTLSDTLAAASLPATLKILEGAVSKTFTVKTVPVAASQSGEVRATLGSTTLGEDLTVRPMGMSSVSLSPISVVGGLPVAGTVKLECKAGPGAVTADLASSNPAAASPVAASLAVPQGVQSVSFDVRTSAVLSQTSATISATANGIMKSRKLTVNVAASVSPTSLRFGNVTVGATSGVLSTTLSNRGAVPYAILSIGFTGTSAKHFVQTNDCPATLAVGATCRVDVRFAPTTAGSKSVQLKIATSAKSTALSVTVSGTGVVP